MKDLRKRANLEKQAFVVGRSEDDVLRRFPNAKKTSDYQYIAQENGMNIYIGWDSAFDTWKIYGRTQANPSIFQGLMNFFMSKA